MYRLLHIHTVITTVARSHLTPLKKQTIIEQVQKNVTL